MQVKSCLIRPPVRLFASIDAADAEAALKELEELGFCGIVEDRRGRKRS